jgi:hypothetical protein
MFVSEYLVAPLTTILVIVLLSAFGNYYYGEYCTIVHLLLGTGVQWYLH